ncbi:glutamine cyclotransferase [Salinisphaera sp. S4-8]|uniref:glutaminyl-peptide cyclotransferase n=1 Tax=Salinisphaera sp. S4-8 TaxID=633357 RepID=UPI00333E65BE
MRRFFSLVAAALLLLGSCACAEQPTPLAQITGELPHDDSAFTQGLLYYDGALFETTGKRGHSRLRRVDPTSGEITRQIQLPQRYFGEGLARVGNRLFWLTWQAQQAFVFDIDTFERVGKRTYEGEGWGLTYDGAHLIMSDGSASLRVLDPADFSVVRRIAVHDGDHAIDKLNELEYIDGEIWANIWYSDRIARIDPQTGAVRAWLDARNLRTALGDRGANANVLNGIAWDGEHRRIYLTGKYWPTLFSVAAPAELAPTASPR